MEDDVVPLIETAWHQRSSRRVQVKPRSQQQHPWRRSEGTASRGCRWIGSTQSAVEVLQAVWIRKIFLLLATTARENIKISSQPAFVLGQQFRYETGGRRWIGSDQFFPTRRGTFAARDNHTSVADAQFSSIKIQHCGIGRELTQPNRVLERFCGLYFEPRKRPVKAGNRRIKEHAFQQVSAVFSEILLAQLSPVAFGKQNRDCSGRVRVLERFSSLQRLLQSRQWEPRVDGEKRPLRILGLQRRAGSATIRPDSITKNTQ